MSDASSGLGTGRGFRRDLFEIENARNLTRRELVSTFVPTRVFWRLLSAKNHIILGSRGSGKTALAKMLSHDHLALLRDSRARRAIRSRAFVGIYVPTRLEWVGGLRNKPWQNEEEKERFFQWRLNVASCQALLATIRSCLDVYVRDKGDRVRKERSICEGIGESWATGAKEYSSLVELLAYLEDLEHRRQIQVARLRALEEREQDEPTIGEGFATELFHPVRRGISVIARELELSDETAWLLCLDEAEFLEPLHHRIINSHLRVHSGNLFFKITTMPYAHHTLATNVGAPLNVGHDFEYVYIDQDPIVWSGTSSESGRGFAAQIFQKRAELSGPKYRGLTLKMLLGESELLDPKLSDWGPSSSAMGLLRRYGSPETLERANRLGSERKEFRDQIARKIHGALLLREAVAQLRGRNQLNVYSGEGMAVRCSDSNPRRLIRMFNAFLLQVKWPRRSRGARYIKLNPLPRTEQTRVLSDFSTSTLTRVQSEPGCGRELFVLLCQIGSYMHDALHKEPLGTDQISSISVVRADGPEVWGLVQRAVGLGLLFPNVSSKNPDQMPEGEGVFHLAYVLAPYFRILPRRGKARRLSSILHPDAGDPGASSQLDLGFDQEGE